MDSIISSFLKERVFLKNNRNFFAKRIKVEINGQALPVCSFSGGDPVAEKVESTSGSSPYNEVSIGHNSISEITIVSYVTPDQNVLSDAVNLVVNQGVNKRFTIKITVFSRDNSVLKTFVYDQCLITSLDFPTMDAQGGEILCETATFKPTILTVS